MTHSKVNNIMLTQLPKVTFFVIFLTESRLEGWEGGVNFLMGKRFPLGDRNVLGQSKDDCIRL